MLNIENNIIESKNFKVATIIQPHIDRLDGGHIVVISKIKKYIYLTDLPLDIATELLYVSMLAGKAMKTALNSNGIDVELINYQINGNWSANSKNHDPIHMHIYGRAKSAINQKFGEALFLPNPDTGFYDSFSGLIKDDISKIKIMMLREIKTVENNEFL